MIYIGAGELLREANVDTTTMRSAPDAEVAKLVLELIKQAEQKMQGFVLDGFPRSVSKPAILGRSYSYRTYIACI